jgi:transaldolase
MKELYLDTANLDDIRSFVKSEAIQGVTTNPSLMAKEVAPISANGFRTNEDRWNIYVNRLREIRQILLETKRKLHLSVEVTTSNPKEMAEQAVRLHGDVASDDIDVFVKIPVMLETLDVISYLSNKRVKVNATACMTALQAKLAHDAGAPIISFFYNRMIDGHTGEMPPSDATMRALGQIATFSHELNRNARIICGSIRKPDDLMNCWVNGADIVTVGPKIIREAIVHPQTDKAIKQFQEDIDRWLS